jgi:EpsI family protein
MMTVTAIAKATIAAVVMGIASVAGFAAKPAPRDPNLPPAIVLEDAIPKQFGDWRLMPSSALVVNPQTQELLDKLYSQTLSRTYVDSQGYRIMLSLAYGDDQRGGLQAHMPEVCYPAQGFKVNSLQDHVITTPFGQITGKRLSTSLGQRLEPITYWFALGEQAVQSRWEKRLIEIRLGLTGQVPDGLLFRVSSIDPDTERAYAKHEEFVAALLASANPAQRVKLAGV